MNNQVPRTCAEDIQSDCQTEQMTNNQIPRMGLLSPLYALWSLGGVVGIPALLFGIGYLVDKGHTTLLNLPTAPLSANSEQLFFLGALWLILTLKTLVWHWLTIVIIVIVIFTTWLWRKFLKNFKLWKNYKPGAITLLIILIILMSILVSLEFNVIGYHSYKLVGDQPENIDAMEYFLATQEAEGLRKVVYHVLSLFGLIAGAGLVWILKSPVADKGQKYFAILNTLQFVAVGVCLIALLNWPICYGRLILPYTRPEISIKTGKVIKLEIKGLVLNPHSKIWIICSSAKTGEDETVFKYHNFELKDLKEFKVIGYKYLFDYGR